MSQKSSVFPPRRVAQSRIDAPTVGPHSEKFAFRVNEVETQHLASLLAPQYTYARFQAEIFAQARRTVGSTYLNGKC